MMSWLISFTSDVLCRYKVHENGRTNYEMVTGHRFKQPTCGFGEKVHFKINTDKNDRSKMETDWSIGYYLGSNGRTLEHLIGSDQGIIKCDTFKRMEDDLAYDKACLETVKVGYREFVLKGASSKMTSTRTSDPLPRNPSGSAPVILARRTRITPNDLREHGYTVGCPGFEFIELGVGQRRGHTEDCRARIEEAMAQSELGRDKLQKTRDRLDLRTAQIGADMVIDPNAPELVEAPKESREVAVHPADDGRHAETPPEELVDAEVRTSDRRFNTPDRKPAVKRRGPEHFSIGDEQDHGF